MLLFVTIRDKLLTPGAKHGSPHIIGANRGVAPLTPPNPKQKKYLRTQLWVEQSVFHWGLKKVNIIPSITPHYKL